MADSNGETLKYRVQQLEIQVEKLDGKIDLLLTNHLPHIQEEISRLRTRIDVLTAINIGAIILAVIANKFLSG